MKRKKTGFEVFAQRYLIVTMVLFVFGNIAIKAMESAYNNDYQELEAEIKVIKSSIDGLEMNKQELVSFTRLTDVAQSKGYTYSSDAVASTITNSPVVSE